MTTLYRFSEGVDVGSGRTVHGVAMPYGEVTEVSDGGRPYRERFEFGAFARSIAERGAKVRLFTQHDTRRLPVGRVTELVERSDGLHVAFALPATRDADDALELVRSGTVDGFSVGFVPVKDRRDGDVTVRLEASLREVSLVHSPAYPGALVAGVRSTVPHLSREIAVRRLAIIDKDFR
jgi:HK97 family phage prohead protease